VASLPPTGTLTLGWHRLEVFAALIDGPTMLAASLWIVYAAWWRCWKRWTRSCGRSTTSTTLPCSRSAGPDARCQPPWGL